MGKLTRTAGTVLLVASLLAAAPACKGDDKCSSYRERQQHDEAVLDQMDREADITAYNTAVEQANLDREQATTAGCDLSDI